MTTLFTIEPTESGTRLRADDRTFNVSAELAAQAQKLANAQAEADAAAKLGTVKTDEKNAASDILNMFSGYQSPSGVEV